MFSDTPLEWLTSNSLVNFPLKENAPRSNGELTLPKDFLIDAVIYGGKSSSRYFVSRVTRTATTIELFISTGTPTLIGGVSIPINQSSIRQMFVLTGPDFDTNTTVQARLLIGEGVLFFSSVPVKTYNFTLAQAEFEPSVIVPHDNRVLSLGKLGSEGFEGEVLFEDGINTKITVSTSGEIKVDAGAGLGLGGLEDCDQLQRRCISKINGKVVKDCDFKIRYSDCIETPIIPTGPTAGVQCVHGSGTCCSITLPNGSTLFPTHTFMALLEIAGVIGEVRDPQNPRGLLPSIVNRLGSCGGGSWCSNIINCTAACTPELVSSALSAYGDVFRSLSDGELYGPIRPCTIVPGMCSAIEYVKLVWQNSCPLSTAGLLTYDEFFSRIQQLIQILRGDSPSPGQPVLQVHNRCRPKVDPAKLTEIENAIADVMAEPDSSHITVNP